MDKNSRLRADTQKLQIAREVRQPSTDSRKNDFSSGTFGYLGYGGGRGGRQGGKVLVPLIFPANYPKTPMREMTTARYARH